MNFRPISLLQTGYKVYMKVIATRAQQVLSTPIGESQQGFVHGRNMMKTVMMMMAILAQANHQPELAAELSEVILLLDFKKAYDTVSREFLFLVLQKFGFSEAFINMLRKLHDGTTAQFLVNGELSEVQVVRSGIRQGCPLAPLLFILAAEILSLAVQQDPNLRGIAIPGGNGARHSFSAFVDDSTVFLEHANQVPRVMELVREFGRMSGLQVQPTKSHLIFLNTAVQEKTYCGLPVLPHGDTVRYLGYAVGTGPLQDVNWAGRIRSIQHRLATATQLATSVTNRVTLLNVIMLPAVLFTAAVFEMPQWADQQLCNLQKQFLWRHSTATEASRHKMSPGLVFAPRQAGGVGLASVRIAFKTQKVKHAMLWLIQKPDVYFWAWKAWVFRGGTSTGQRGITPALLKPRLEQAHRRTPGDTLTRLLGSWIQPPEEDTPAAIADYQNCMRTLELESISWTVKKEWLLELPGELPQPRQRWTPEQQRFWATFAWTSNPWIRDKEGRMLEASKFSKIQDCQIEDLRITRTGKATFSFRIPTKGPKPHQEAKLRRWALAILLNSPRLRVGEVMQVQPDLELRHPPQLQHEYQWRVNGEGQALGTLVGPQKQKHRTIVLVQRSDGIHWEVGTATQDNAVTAQDRRRLEHQQQTTSIVFYAHPALHRFPWQVPDTVANRHVLQAIKKQPYKRYRGSGSEITTVLAGLQATVETSTWQRAAMGQTPTQLWAHSNELTEYQVWVNYRLAVRQLNLFHADRPHNNCCRQLPACAKEKETLEQLFWDCPCAQACWRRLIQHWTGELWADQELERFQPNCANRQAPPISAFMRASIRSSFPDEEQEYTEE